MTTRDSRIPRAVPDGGSVMSAYLAQGSRDQLRHRYWTQFNELRRRSNSIARYVEHLRNLGVSDLTSASGEYEELLALQRQATSEKSGHNRRWRAETQRNVATGVVTVDDALRTIDEHELDDESARRDRLAILDVASSAAYRRAGEALHAAGDRLIVEVCRPIVDEALAKPKTANAQARYGEAIALASLLRSGGRFAADCGASDIEYAFDRPHRVREWQCEHATKFWPSQLIGQRPDGVMLLWERPIDPPKPTRAAITENRDGWGATCLTASEVLANLKTIAAEQRGDDLVAPGRRPFPPQPE
jgi:hypothetical protein